MPQRTSMHVLSCRQESIFCAELPCWKKPMQGVSSAPVSWLCLQGCLDCESLLERGWGAGKIIFMNTLTFLLWTSTPVFSTNSAASVTYALGKAVVRNSRCKIYTAESIPSFQFTNSAENDPSGAGLFYELWPQAAHWKCSYYQIVLCRFPF